MRCKETIALAVLMLGVSAAPAATRNQNKTKIIKPCTRDQFTDTGTTGDVEYGRHSRNRGQGFFTIYTATDGTKITVTAVGFHSEAAASKAFQHELANKKEIIEPVSTVHQSERSSQKRVVVASLGTNGVRTFRILSLNGDSISAIMSPSLRDAECFEQAFSGPH